VRAPSQTDQYKNHRAAFDATARRMTAQHASAESPAATHRTSPPRSSPGGAVVAQGAAAVATSEASERAEPGQKRALTAPEPIADKPPSRSRLQKKFKPS
jgi:hypothetical protein